MKLHGAKVLVTGATGGIGRALAVELARRGGEMVLTGRRTDLLDPLAEQLGGRAIPADLDNPDAVEELLNTAGEIDVLVANAALTASGLLADYSVAEIDRALQVNLRAPIVMAKLASEHMAARGRGHLVFISSLSGKAASGKASLYNATKFGMRGFALALREDMRPHNVGVSTVFPGFIRDAGMFADSGATLPRAPSRTTSPRWTWRRWACAWPRWSAAPHPAWPPPSNAAWAATRSPDSSPKVNVTSAEVRSTVCDLPVTRR
jgi:short-subunit dehydrogenase